MKKESKRAKLYEAIVTIPDRIYPFASFVEGELVRGRTSYDHRLAQIRAERGDGHYGFKLIAYREFCHIIGAILFISSTTLVSKALWGSDRALPILFMAAIFFIAVQEFYYHPKMYGQLPVKSFLDWMSWALPFGLYTFLIVHSLPH